MELVEVVLQGVQGSPGLSRWVLPTGVSVIPAGEREALVARAAYELLAGIQEGVVGPALLPGEAGAQGRVAVVVTGRDQRRYRVLWDLKTGRRALQVQNGEKFEVITTTQAEILQAVTATVGFPQQDALRELFFAFVDDLPSRRTSDVVVAAAGPTPSGKFGKPLPPGFDDAPAKKKDSDKPLPPGFGDDDGPPQSRWFGKPASALHARLQEIAEQSADTVDVPALEFELDGLQKKQFELDARLKPLVDLGKAVDAIEGQLTRVAHLDRLPADFLERATSLKKIKADHETKVERLAGDRERLLANAEHLSDEVSGIKQRGGARPMQAAMNFGAAGGVVAVVVGAFGGFFSDGLRWVALLDIPAFGVAVFGGIRLLGSLEEGASFRFKLARLDADKKKLEERFAIDKEQIERLLQQNELTFEQLPEIEQGWKLREDLQARLKTAQEERAAASEQGDIVAIKAEKEQGATRIRALEEQLQTAGQRFDGGSSAELLKEKSEIEKILSGELKPTKVERKLDLDELMGGSSSSSSSPPAPVAAFDAGQRIVRLASDVLLGTVDDTATRLAPRATQMTQALTDKRFSEVRFGSKAEVSVVDAASGKAIAFVHLPAGDRDLVALALRLAVVEAFAKTNRMPVIFDRVFDTFPVEKAPLLVRVLQFLGQGTQVICLTARRELAAAGPVVTASSSS
jgi:DNA repair exonuclease SbcCD ATPase subunit